MVQCGENHVTPLCQALSTLLTGRQTAGVFLPRYTFATMNPDEIKRHFLMHEKYIKSLHQVSLAPFVAVLDKIRVEYWADGTTIERTTREWALSLTLPDGTAAQCDIGTGGSDKPTCLLIPAAFSAVIKPLVKAYKESIHTVSRREARYRENIPDLPDVIHITSNVQSNLDFMAQLSAADIWNNAPTSVKPSPYASGPPTGTAEMNDSSVASPSGESKVHLGRPLQNVHHRARMGRRRAAVNRTPGHRQTSRKENVKRIQRRLVSLRSTTMTVPVPLRHIPLLTQSRRSPRLAWQNWMLKYGNVAKHCIARMQLHRRILLLGLPTPNSIWK